MKSDKLKNVIIVMLLLIIVMLVLLIGYVYQDKNKDNIVNGDNNQGQENVDSDFNIEEDDEDNDIEIKEDNNLNKYTENDFIRETQVTLIEEPLCSGNGSSLIATIESDGNISVSRAGSATLITPGNAKYLYRVEKIVCDSVDLYYITDNGKLYLVSQGQLNSGKDEVAVKVTESNAVEFLGTELKETEEGYNYYLKVLLKNGNVEYIKYLTTLK